MASVKVFKGNNTEQSNAFTPFTNSITSSTTFKPNFSFFEWLFSLGEQKLISQANATETFYQVPAGFTFYITDIFYSGTKGGSAGNDYFIITDKTSTSIKYVFKLNFSVLSQVNLHFPFNIPLIIRSEEFIGIEPSSSENFLGIKGFLVSNSLKI